MRHFRQSEPHQLAFMDRDVPAYCAAVRPLIAQERLVLLDGDRLPPVGPEDFATFVFADRPGIERRIAQARSHRPRAVLLLVATASRSAARIARLAVAGIDDVFFIEQIGENDRLIDTIRAAAQVNALCPPPPIPALRKAPRDPARSFHEIVFRTSFRRQSVADLVSRLGMNRRTLERSLAHADMARPAELMRSALLLRVASLRQVGVPLDMIAFLLGFPSQLSLQRTIRRRSKRAPRSEGDAE